MRLIKPSFEILWYPSSLELLEAAGRTCYLSEPEGDSGAFIKMIIKRGHESVLEHETISVRIICDRGISHELVRHRIASFSQESTRYCDYSGEIEFIIPSWVDEAKDGVWVDAMENAANAYTFLRGMGWKPEQARSVLPNSLKTEIVMTLNLRSWRNFFKLRTSPAAHPQMREIAIPMLKAFKELVPVVFDDLFENIDDFDC